MARNEGPYIADWIFHHLYFGFSPIIVVLHDCTDSTKPIAQEISKYFDVHLLDARRGIHNYPDSRSTQVAAYREGLEVAKANRASHAFLCDIDEFWTPINFNSSIQSTLNQFSDDPVIAFQWRNKWNDLTPFSSPFEQENTLIPNRHIKSAFPLNAPLDWVDVHSVGLRAASYVLSNGAMQDQPGNAKQNLIAEGKFTEELKAFILHRYWRSEMEYVVGLGRGLRQACAPSVGRIPEPEAIELRTNRWGYLPGGSIEKFQIPADTLQRYDSWISTSMRNSKVLKLRAFDQKQLVKQYTQVRERINLWVQDKEKAKYLADSLRGLSTPDLVEAKKTASIVANHSPEDT